MTQFNIDNTVHISLAHFVEQSPLYFYISLCAKNWLRNSFTWDKMRLTGKSPRAPPLIPY